MKTKFNPEVEIINFDDQEFIATSNCFEANACTKCYCSAVECSGTYTCTERVCPTYDQY